jgi:phospholipase C
LADGFTICDAYHSSVIGPSDPNHLYAFSATIDPSGTRGGPMLTTPSKRDLPIGQFTWTTMPEQLSARGIDWKVYASRKRDELDNILACFRQYGRDPRLKARGLGTVYPHAFLADVRRDELPQVSWVLGDLDESEHPGFSSARAGQAITRSILTELMSRPKLWAKTAVLITWDENGGFFDHVAPPTPDPGTKDEFLTVEPLPSTADGVRGPIGLGFRVPLLVVSPFSRGGFVCSDVFDHTSILRLLETRFGAEVPNLSDWRRSVTGDLTSAFNFAAPDPSIPAFPPDDIDHVVPCRSPEVEAPPPNRMPVQEPGTAKRPSGIVQSR